MHRMRCLNLFPNHQKSAVPPFSTSLVGKNLLIRLFTVAWHRGYAYALGDIR